MPKINTIYVIYSGNAVVVRVARTKEEAEEIAKRLSITRGNVHIKEDSIIIPDVIEDEQI
jgi:hypothetical protein